MWIFVELLTVFLLRHSAAESCICASQDTKIYPRVNTTGITLGVLSAASCLPYKNKQASSEEHNMGFLHALVQFKGQEAWVPTSSVYVRSCSEPFSCVCAVKSTQIWSNTSQTKSIKQFIVKTCLQQGQRDSNQDGGWTKVKMADGKTGWVKTQDIAFHDQCKDTDYVTLKSDVQLPGCPPIITRVEWGARPSRDVNLLTQTPTYLIVHHGATVGCTYREECIREVRAYQDFHMDGHGWDDIGYSFLIGGDGSVFEGRGWNRIGAHTHYYNDVGLGTCVVGNYMERPPTTKQLDKLMQLFNCTVTNEKVIPDYTLLGHRDTNNKTLCPGDKLHDIIEQWPHFNLKNRRVTIKPTTAGAAHITHVAMPVILLTIVLTT